MHLSSPVQAPALGFHSAGAPKPRCEWSNVGGEPTREAEKGVSTRAKRRE